MEVHVIKATQAPHINVRLITVELSVPLYVWTEILTHRSFARNASSARAMSTKRYVDMGYYTPTEFFYDQKGMQSSHRTFTGWRKRAASLVWHATMKAALFGSYVLDNMGNAKEQKNRLIPPTKYVRAIITGTQKAFEGFLRLRNNTSADKAMQQFARMLRKELDTCTYEVSRYHVPYGDLHTIERSVARAARVSYNRGNATDDANLVKRLSDEFHMSPFEHQAVFVGSENPLIHGVHFTSQPEVVADGYFGWKTLRSHIEQGNTLETFSLLGVRV